MRFGTPRPVKAISPKRVHPGPLRSLARRAEAMSTGYSWRSASRMGSLFFGRFVARHHHHRGEVKNPSRNLLRWRVIASMHTAVAVTSILLANVAYSGGAALEQNQEADTIA